MRGFTTVPNPDQPERCPSIDPYDTLQCGRRIHYDDQCWYGEIAWKKGTPRHVTAEEQVEELRVEVARLTDLVRVMLGKAAVEGRCGCSSSGEGPQEDCTLHGREYGWWVGLAYQACEDRRALQDEIEGLRVTLDRVKDLAEEWHWKDPGEPPAPEWEILDAASADLRRVLTGEVSG
jgi:hypothetical protein